GEYAPGIPITFGTTIIYFVAEMIGAFLGAILAWMAYKNHYDQETDPGAILGTFSTGPEIRSKGWNVITEIIATFVLVFVIIMFGNTPHELGPSRSRCWCSRSVPRSAGPRDMPSTRPATSG